MNKLQSVSWLYCINAHPAQLLLYIWPLQTFSIPTWPACEAMSTLEVQDKGHYRLSQDKGASTYA